MASSSIAGEGILRFKSMGSCRYLFAVNVVPILVVWFIRLCVFSLGSGGICLEFDSSLLIDDVGLGRFCGLWEFVCSWRVTEIGVFLLVVLLIIWCSSSDTLFDSSVLLDDVGLDIFCWFSLCYAPGEWYESYVVCYFC